MTFGTTFSAIAADRASCWHRLLPAALLGVALLTGAGCAAPGAATPPVSVGEAIHSRVAPSGAGNVRTSPAYQQAVASYQSHHYADALRQLDALSAAPTLTAPDKAFLERQRALCQAALTGKPVANTASPTTATRPTVKPSSALGDCGPRALLLVCQEQHIPASLATLTQAAHTTREGTSLAGLAKAANGVGFKASGVQMDKDALASLHSPAIAWVEGNHFVAVLAVHNRHASLIGGADTATIHDPNQKGEEEVPLARLLARSGGILLTLTPQTPQKARLN